MQAEEGLGRISARCMRPQGEKGNKAREPVSRDDSGGVYARIPSSKNTVGPPGWRFRKRVTSNTRPSMMIHCRVREQSERMKDSYETYEAVLSVVLSRSKK